MNKKKILVVGSSAKEYALAKYFSEDKNIETVYVAPGNPLVCEFAQCVDIRENSVSELLEFAIKNGIDLTVASSSEAIKSDITSYFRENSQLIFAPDKESASFAISRAYAKKFLYKQHIKIPKFGIFDKLSSALDYVKNERYPLLITADEDTENSVRTIATTVNFAQTCLNDIFLQDEDKAVIEEYEYGHPFTLYVITDGYQALPLTVVGDYKFLEDGDAGLFTPGSGAYVPDYKVSFDVVEKMMNSVVEVCLSAHQRKGNPYVGILGVDAVLKSDDSFVIVGFTPFFKEHHIQAVLNSLDTGLYEIFEACANGSFAHDYEDIPLKDISSVSCVLFSRNSNSVITGLELVDDTTDITPFGITQNSYFEKLTNKGRTMVVTQTSSTISRARELLYDNVEEISFNGKKYRRDICAE